MQTHEMNHVSQFLYYMWNVWTKDVCLEIYGKIMGEHFWNKFTEYRKNRGFDHAVVQMWFEMSELYRNKLLDAALKHYANQ